jgi:hypothetical protein
MMFGQDHVIRVKDVLASANSLSLYVLSEVLANTGKETTLGARF